MTTFQHTFDLSTDTTDVTVANSGTTGGDAFVNLVINNSDTPGGSSAIQYLTAAAIEGARGMRITAGAATTYVRWKDPSPGTRSIIRVPVRFSSNPTATVMLCELRSAASAMGSVRVDSTGRITAYNRTGAALTASRFQATTDTLYWAEVAATPGVDTVTGRIEMKVYSSDGTTEVWSYDSGATVDSGTAAHDHGRIGGITNTTGWTSVDYDSIRYSGDQATGWLGPVVVTNTPPVADAGIDQSVRPGVQVTIDGSGSTDPDGSITSYVWTQTAGNAVTLVGSGPTRTFSAPYAMSQDTYTFQLTVTDDGGANSAGSVSIIVSAHPEWYLKSDGSWHAESYSVL